MKVVFAVFVVKPVFQENEKHFEFKVVAVGIFTHLAIGVDGVGRADVLHRLDAGYIIL